MRCLGGGRGCHKGLGASDKGLDILEKNTGINKHNIGSTLLDQYLKGNERVQVSLKHYVQLYAIHNLHILNASP